MVTLDRIFLSIAGQRPYFKPNQSLKDGGNYLNFPLEDYELLIDEIKLDDSGEVIMVEDPEEGEIPLIETKPFDREVKGVLTMDFIFIQRDDRISSTALFLPEGVDEVLGYNISTTMANKARRNV